MRPTLPSPGVGGVRPPLQGVRPPLQTRPARHLPHIVGKFRIGLGSTCASSVYRMPEVTTWLLSGSEEDWPPWRKPCRILRARCGIVGRLSSAVVARRWITHRQALEVVVLMALTLLAPLVLVIVLMLSPAFAIEHPLREQNRTDRVDVGLVSLV